jgi:diadenosine tetraphosphate (Ap4A) HIT family hydrolase
MNDAHYPWLILVPQRPNLREIFELNTDDQIQLIHESSFVARCMSTLFNAEKMNIAALGNLVAQLHIHHIARYQTDPAWPAPVWGHAPAQPYTPDALDQRLRIIRHALAA